MRSSAAALPAFEITVAGRSAAFALSENVFVHRQAHRTSGVAPFETGVDEYFCKAFFFCLAFYLHRAGNDHRIDAAADLITLGDLCSLAKVLDPRIRAR